MPFGSGNQMCTKEGILPYMSFGISCLTLILIFKTPMTEEISCESDHLSCLVD